MYELSINTNKYNINMLIQEFGNRKSKSIAKKIDVAKTMKRLKRTISHFNMEKLSIPA